MDSSERRTIERLIEEILREIGEDTNREGLIDTPRRVAQMLREVFSGVDRSEEELVKEIKTFTESRVSDQLIVIRHLSFSSMCEHHFLPFSGLAHVAYIPNGDGIITGLSKVPRVLDVLAKRPQVQERLTDQLFRVLDQALSPKGLLVTLDATHACMTCRGVNKPGSRTSTLRVGGVFESDADWRRDAIELIRQAA